jgi:pimeloyl-ACP methyl ester carboxylesterase
MFWLFIISLILVLLIVVFNSVPWAEKKILFYPSKITCWKPNIKHENVYINVNYPERNARHRCDLDCYNYIHGWYFNNFPGRQTVMYCHGNSGNISHRSYIVDICKKFQLNLFIFDYRGYGKSSCSPCKKYLKKDGEAAYKFLTVQRNVNPKNLIIWGESLGGYVAIWTASKFKCKALILLSTFSGLNDAIINYFDTGLGKGFAQMYSKIVGLRYDIMLSKNYIKNVRCPVAIMHSECDDIIPYRCAEILYENVKTRKILLTIKGKHSAPIIAPSQLNKLFSFCGIYMPDFSSSGEVKNILKNLETIASKHNNFIDPR